MFKCRAVVLALVAESLAKDLTSLSSYPFESQELSRSFLHGRNTHPDFDSSMFLANLPHCICMITFDNFDQSAGL